MTLATVEVESKRRDIVTKTFHGRNKKPCQLEVMITRRGIFLNSLKQNVIDARRFDSNYFFSSPVNKSCIVV